jgi:hypothetical protein
MRPVAEAAENNTPAPYIPLLVPLEAALNFLHDGCDPAALTAPLTDRNFDQKTRVSLRDRLAGIGGRWRGEIDNGRPQWLEAAEWLDYQFVYETFSGAGNAVATVSRQIYSAAEVRNHDFPEWSAGELRYRLVVRNVKIETAPLLKIAKAVPRVSSGLKIKRGRVLDVLADLDREHKLKDGMRPSELAKMVSPAYRRRWPDTSDVSVRTIVRAYNEYRRTIDAKITRQTR